MNILSLKQNPELAETAIAYIQDKWASPESMMVYEDGIKSSLTSDSTIPEWYVAIEDETIIGCVGIIPNDFISRMDLWPWLCALYVEPEHRNKGIGKALIDHCYQETQSKGFDHLYLCTDHIGYYEKYDLSTSVMVITLGENPQESIRSNMRPSNRLVFFLVSNKYENL